jgi:hypothetical protein
MVDDVIAQTLSDRQAAASLIAGGMIVRVFGGRVTDVQVPDVNDARRKLDEALDAPEPGPRDWDRARLVAILSGKVA